MISIIGLGFVGLTTALGFCEKGYKVYGFDNDLEKVNNLKNYNIPFFEPNLRNKLKKHLNNNLTFVQDSKEAIINSEIVFLCVGTPNNSDGSTNFSYLYNALENILMHSKKNCFKVIVIKSTIPPSSTEEKIKPFLIKKGFSLTHDIGISHNPEFLREGFAWDDFMNPDRIVIGTEHKRTETILKNLYKPFNVTVYNVSLNTAEFIKYLSNSLLATLISYSNEMSIIADSIGKINIRDAFNILHKDKRWSGEPSNMSSYVYPGCGFGGYCLPKDTEALYNISKDKGYQAEGLNSTILINKKMPQFIVNRIKKNISTNKTIGILGLSFKPNSDDVRGTPSYPIIQSLLENGYKDIVVYDPMANEQFKNYYNLKINYSDSLEEITKITDCLILLTAWKEFIDKINFIKKSTILFDFRYLKEKEQL